MTSLYFRSLLQRLLITGLTVHILVLVIASLFVSLLNFTPPNWMQFFDTASIHSDILLPLSFLLTTTYILQTSKRENEILALQTSGLSPLFLARPYFAFAIIAALIAHANAEFSMPKVRAWKNPSKQRPFSPFTVRHLPDQSRLVYKSDLTDFYWIRPGEIWHAQKIELGVGSFVDKLQKTESGRWEKTASYTSYLFPFTLEVSTPSDQKQSLTQSLYAWVHPWFPLLFTTALFAFLFSSRTSSPFLPFLFSIFLFLLFYSVIKTFVILGENYVVSPWIPLIFFPLGIQVSLIVKLCSKQKKRTKNSALTPSRQPSSTPL